MTKIQNTHSIKYSQEFGITELSFIDGGNAKWFSCFLAAVFFPPAHLPLQDNPATMVLGIYS